jgi:DNA-binding MarR family transcriptional regulator
MVKGRNGMDNYFALFEMIGVLARRRYQTAEREMAAIGLNHTEARLLSLLSEAGGESAQDALSNQLHIDRSNAGRALKRLEQDGYITRVRDEADRRAFLVQLTGKGRRAVRDIMKVRNAIVASFFGELTEEEAGRAVALLEKALAGEVG